MMEITTIIMICTMRHEKMKRAGGFGLCIFYTR